MPEVRFQIQWPDGVEESCYSPSLVIKQYLESEAEYALSDFLERSRTALQEGSKRVEAKFGFPCSLALGQLKRLEAKSSHYADQVDAKVRVLKFSD